MPVMSLSVISVTGMTCEHCEKAVRAEISAIPGVSQVDVDVASGEVRVLAEPVPDMATLRAAVEEAGYQLADRS
jgi:copper chaperone